MSDPNMTDFQVRIQRLQKDRAKGLGFEAPGALGRSFYYQPKARRRSILGPVVFLALAVLLAKGTIHSQIGAEAYNDRVATLMAGDGVEWAGGWLMQEEPATQLVSQGILWLLSKTM